MDEMTGKHKCRESKAEKKRKREASDAQYDDAQQASTNKRQRSKRPSNSATQAQELDSKEQLVSPSIASLTKRARKKQKALQATTPHTRDVHGPTEGQSSNAIPGNTHSNTTQQRPEWQTRKEAKKERKRLARLESQGKRGESNAQQPRRHRTIPQVIDNDSRLKKSMARTQNSVCFSEDKPTVSKGARNLPVPGETWSNGGWRISQPLSGRATTDGHIVKWDVRSGMKLGNWATESQIYALTTIANQASSQEVVFTISKAARWIISAHGLGMEGDHLKTETQPILNLDRALQSLQVLGHGEIVIAITSDSLVIGKRIGSAPASLKNLRYAWREFKCAEAPICFDATYSTTTSDKRADTSLKIAVGGLKGCIYVYQDLLVQLGFEHATNVPEESLANATTELHWHREAVGALAWSADGNYLISGGVETVLVLWQLDTGKKQFLPHLESPIQSLTISPSGASYVVRLGDNSIMVLSTSELLPTTNVANLQTWNLPAIARLRPELPTTEMWSSLNNDTGEWPEVKAVINPRKPTELFAAVSSYENNSNTVPFSLPATYLQTFDMSRSRNVARQVLTRTNATYVNSRPDGSRIREPNVRHLQVSHNGRWLATVDEWSPHSTDVDDLSADLSDIRHAIEQQRTIQLRLWSWNGADQVWALSSRIESPHMLDNSQTPGKVLALIASPTGCAFATVGQDSKTKIWEPKTSFPSGKTFRGDCFTEKGHTTWTVRREISLEKGMSLEPFRGLIPSRAAMAYSQDGSTLAAHLHFDESIDYRESSLIHFIDPDHGVSGQSHTDIFNEPGGIHALRFLGRHLVCVGQNTVIVWDITTMEQHTRILLPASINARLSTSTLPSPLLAVNPCTSTFAIASPVLQTLASAKRSSSFNPLRTYTTKLEVFSLAELVEKPSAPVCSITLPRLALCLLSVGKAQGNGKPERSNDNLGGDSKGYVVIDAGATIRSIQPLSGVETGFLPHSGATSLNQQDEAAAVRVDEDELSSGDEIARTLSPFGTAPADRVVVNAEELAQLFDRPALAMPSMADLLGSVLNIYATNARAVQV
ncbi:hypothetical protein FH972_021917 [Carpinus fangiana]|uniref:Uncharacterized protein n=1 Tax=Carpinus fangiana TaxID=176857 RepID=A0A5N6KR31_9ROSI|nr:hypothetical protein FH972_021917 [Carpinus fangiana]